MRTGDETKATREVGAAAAPSLEQGSGAGGTQSGRTVRLAVNLGPEPADVLKEYASRKGVSVTEAVRRAIAVLAFVDDAQRRGASINVEEDGVLKEVMFLT
jgi:hypothetical protein